LVAFLVHIRACSCGFIWGDDDWYVTGNDHVHAGLTPASMLWALTTIGPPYWHPITWLSLEFDSTVYGLNPAGFHLTNVVLHSANAMLLFWTLRLMTGAVWRSAAVAAVFAVHPIHVESVAWVTERKDVLSTLFWLLATLAYVRYTRRPGVGRYLLVMLCLALGLMCKPMLVTLPCTLLLLDYWPLGRVELADKGSLWRLVPEKLPVFALCVVPIFLTIAAQREAGAVRSFAEMPADARVANALLAYVAYLRQALWPTGLAFFYPEPSRSLTEGSVLGAALFLGSVTALTVWQARRLPFLVVGWLWYLGTLVPVIGIIQAGWQARADRFSYVPLIGVYIAVAWGIGYATRSWRYQKQVTAWGTATVLVALAAVTVVQIGYWRNSIVSYKRTVDVTTGHYIAHTYLAQLLERDGRLDEAKTQFELAAGCHRDQAEGHLLLGGFLQRRGLLDEAAEEYRLAAQVNPANAEAENNLAVVLSAQQKPQEAIDHLRQAVRLDPRLADAQYNLAAALTQQGDLDEAVEHFEQCLAVTPNRVLAHIQVAKVLCTQGRHRDALRHLQAAAGLKSKDAEVQFELGQVLRRLGRPEEAIAAYRLAIELQPQTVHYRTYLAYTSFLAGQTSVAKEEYQTALHLHPGWIGAAQQVAWRAATQRSASAAVAPETLELAEQACQATEYQNPVMLDTLAVALADCGRFDDAAKTAERASALAANLGQIQFSNEIQERIRHFKSGQRFRPK
jgi:tetratricopeptide (TPR) repeat protein